MPDADAPHGARAVEAARFNAGEVRSLAAVAPTQSGVGVPLAGAGQVLEVLRQASGERKLEVRFMDAGWYVSWSPLTSSWVLTRVRLRVVCGCDSGALSAAALVVELWLSLGCM